MNVPEEEKLSEHKHHNTDGYEKNNDTGSKVPKDQWKIVARKSQEGSDLVHGNSNGVLNPESFFPNCSYFFLGLFLTSLIFS